MHMEGLPIHEFRGFKESLYPLSLTNILNPREMPNISTSCNFSPQNAETEHRALMKTHGGQNDYPDGLKQHLPLAYGDHFFP